MRSAGLALSGIGFAVRTQKHMRIHCIAAFLIIALGAVVTLNVLEWALICFAITLVFCAELMNTAIEQTVDLVSPQRHPLAKAAKDVAAGAVMAASLGAVVIGILIVGPPLWRLLF